MVLLLLITTQLVLSLRTELIPSTGVPPVSMKAACLISNSSETLYVFGGHEKSNKVHNEIYLFDLKALKWSQSIPIKQLEPTPRYSAGCFAYGNSIYIFGGNTNFGPVNDLWSYNPILMEWTEKSLPNGPSFRYLFSYCNFEYDGNSYFAVYGGWKNEGLSSGLFMLDLENFTWTKLKNGPIPLAGSSMIHINDSLIILGGQSGKFEMNNLILTYNITSQEWNSFELDGWLPRSHFGAAQIKEKIYFMFGWNEQKFDYEPTIMSFDLSTYKLSNVSVTYPSSLLVQNYGFASDQNSLYIFGGLSSSGVTNALIKFSSETISVITKKYSSPRNLMNASLVKITTFLYLFGGMVLETRFNDLWVFDLQQAKWTKTRSFGEIPSPRSHHSAAVDGDIMVIFGGKDDTQYFNDGYQLNTITLTWTVLKYKDLNPSARFNACMVMRLPLIYIYGGETLSGFSLALYKYNISDTTYVRLTDSSGFTPGSGQICFLNEQGDELQVLYGASDGDEPLGYVQSFNFTSKKWNTLYDPERNRNGRARPIIVNVKGNYYITGGSTWATTPRKEILKLTTNNKSVSEIGTLDRVAYLAPSVRYKSKVYILGGATNYNDLIRYDVAIRDFFAFDLFDLCTDDCEYVCSEGSYYNKTLKTCEICPPGTYSPFSGADSCLKCFQGTYNDKFGASSQLQCYPCNQGQYSSSLGSSLCLDCQAGYYCPIGSAYPIMKYNEDRVSSYQPKPFVRPTDKANYLTQEVQIIFGTIGIILVLFLVSADRLKNMIISFDMYDILHNYTDNAPLYKKKNQIGGSFSCVFVVLAFIIVIGAVIPFYLDNVTESKSLIPFAVLKELTSTVKANVQVEVALGNYGGFCTFTSESGEKKCSPSIFYSISGIDSKSSELKCQILENSCVLELEILDFDLGPEAILHLGMQEQFSYTSQITVKVTSDSSIPGEKSQVKMIVYPSENHVFRGETATKFRVSFIPSYYSNQEDGAEETGYHLSPLADPTGGTAYEPTNLGFTSDLQVQVLLERSMNGLRTERTVIRTTFLLLLTLIGSIPGIKTLMGLIMSIVEQRYLGILEYRDKKLMIEEYKLKRLQNANYVLDHSHTADHHEDNKDLCMNL